jgi:hypothetical protein
MLTNRPRASVSLDTHAVAALSKMLQYEASASVRLPLPPNLKRPHVICCPSTVHRAWCCHSKVLPSPIVNDEFIPLSVQMIEPSAPET